MKSFARITAVLLLTSLTACATVDSASRVSAHSPRYYTGTRLNVAALNEDFETLQRFETYGMQPALYPVADLPLSFAADTVLLPYLLLCQPLPYLGSGCFAGGAGDGG